MECTNLKTNNSPQNKTVTVMKNNKQGCAGVRSGLGGALIRYIIPTNPEAVCIYGAMK
tara:strand:+ start:350 stop:523 length:174 start_codon:yes stop_codon:yes gene_type:complete